MLAHTLRKESIQHAIIIPIDLDGSSIMESGWLHGQHVELQSLVCMYNYKHVHCLKILEVSMYFPERSPEEDILPGNQGGQV